MVMVRSACSSATKLTANYLGGTFLYWHITPSWRTALFGLEDRPQGYLVIVAGLSALVVFYQASRHTCEVYHQEKG